MGDRICSEGDCGKPTVGRGFCRRHYNRWWNANADRKPCAIDGCNRPLHGRGWCDAHYKMWQATGDPEGSTRMTFEEHFWSKVSVGHPLGCWWWTDVPKGGGYGVFQRYVDGERRVLSAHRVAYELLLGSIPEGLHIDHLCRNRICVNPDHLEPVTQRENNYRGQSPPMRTHRRRTRRRTLQATAPVSAGGRVAG